MALIPCPECGKDISNQAPACIYCGYPLSPAPAEPLQAAEPDRFTLFLSYCPTYPDVRRKTIHALFDELNYAPEDAKAMVRTALRSPVPLRQRLTQEEAQDLADRLNKTGASFQISDSSILERTGVSVAIPDDKLTFGGAVGAVILGLLIWNGIWLLITLLLSAL